MFGLVIEIVRILQITVLSVILRPFYFITRVVGMPYRCLDTGGPEGGSGAINRSTTVSWRGKSRGCGCKE